MKSVSFETNLEVNFLKYKDLFLLEGLTPEEREKIISLFSPEKKFLKGETIYSPKSFQKAIGYIVSGSAVAVTDNQPKVVMKSFSAGMCFGAAALFGGERNYVSEITANEETCVLFIDEGQLISFFELCPKTAVNYINFLSDKIRFLNRKLKIISCGSAQDSLLKYLADRADEEGKVFLPKNMSMLAKMLGIGRASLYRCLDSLEKEGKIERNKNCIRVKNL